MVTLSKAPVDAETFITSVKIFVMCFCHKISDFNSYCKPYIEHQLQMDLKERMQTILSSLEKAIFLLTSINIQSLTRLTVHPNRGFPLNTVRIWKWPNSQAGGRGEMYDIKSIKCNKIKLVISTKCISTQLKMHSEHWIKNAKNSIVSLSNKLRPKLKILLVLCHRNILRFTKSKTMYRNASWEIEI